MRSSLLSAMRTQEQSETWKTALTRIRPCCTQILDLRNKPCCLLSHSSPDGAGQPLLQHP